MYNMEINIVKEYTDKPGARYEKQGSNSGEKFRDTILYPKFLEAIEKNEVLTVNLDGGYGYGSSFLEETFGGLGVRIDIWTHLMRGCIIELCTPN